MVLAGRFLPGLRTAIPIACAYAERAAAEVQRAEPRQRFAWAGAIMLFVKLRIERADRVRPERAGGDR